MGSVLKTFDEANYSVNKDIISNAAIYYQFPSLWLLLVLLGTEYRDQASIRTLLLSIFPLLWCAHDWTNRYHVLLERHGYPVKTLKT